MQDNSSLQALKGLGPKKIEILQEAGISSLENLFDYWPRRYLDRRAMNSIAGLRMGEMATVVGTVRSAGIEQGGRGMARFKVKLADRSGVLDLTWFRGARYFSRAIVPGDILAVYGKVGYFGRQAQMQHPDFDRLGREGADRDKEGSDAELFNTGRIIPLYPTSEAMKRSGLASRQLRGLIARAFDIRQPGGTENLSSGILKAHSLMPLSEAYRELHQPSSPERLQMAEYRMKWTELFYAQLSFALRRRALRHTRTAVQFSHSGEFTAALHAALPYSLTGAQKNAIRELYRDLKGESPMQRLVQGDVGSGKTIVAMFAMALAADNNLQSVFMAPTEILAVQHWLGMKRLFEPLGIQVCLLTGRQPKKVREALLMELREGRVHIAVGTHALLQHDVDFHSLGLVVIDEQHRFGVLQRKTLQDKAQHPHVLLMTATPIPRTLTMGVFGDLDVSLIREMPTGRQPVRTLVQQEADKPRVFEFLRAEVAAGRQGYIVYPLVEESEKVDLKAAVESFDELSASVFPDLRLGLIHGQMTPDMKEVVMEQFRSGLIDILVGTTVIEVGVDVANATVMVIMHAERFGLAQLHQLRGRVGRGTQASSCFLLYAKLTSDGKERLDAMASTTDGFVISEIDAAIRGAGNLLGKEQSGTLSGLKMADLTRDFDIMQSAREAAFSLVAEDGELREPGHRMIRDWYMRHLHQRHTLADIG
ncbi:ATP-dependent DNA helicase RecG [Chlorobium phaeovibrioides]|uniref:ATP-dependent DNA helicase RecG n=1 Tax=Chlorobium phaeovibrioides TaxID=1094 RepID=A0A5M8ICE6_CHLPH|nr:ATP-dependent DNA helicase RecG [Chlorobium phaeovibrioides]KAA6232039.1 ATP-dependent DNA helicase RecG [Chlorobium phaeovibrioides]